MDDLRSVQVTKMAVYRIDRAGGKKLKPPRYSALFEYGEIEHPLPDVSSAFVLAMHEAMMFGQAAGCGRVYFFVNGWEWVLPGGRSLWDHHLNDVVQGEQTLRPRAPL